MDEINKKLGVLEDKQKAAQARKDQLEKDVELTGKKIERAKSLVMGLGSEQKRWTDISLRLSQEYACLAGDVLLAAAQVSFLGVFTTEYRNEAATQWRGGSTGLTGCWSVPCKPQQRHVIVVVTRIGVVVLRKPRSLSYRPAD